MRPSDLGLPAKFPEFRSYSGFDQLDIALKLATYPERFQILNAATGSGKSVTYSAVAKLRKAKRWAVLVSAKGLQSQLLDDGLVKRLVYGHRNYPCAATASHTEKSDADMDDLDFRCSVPRDRCGYVADVNAAAFEESVVTNCAYWLAIARYGDPDILGKFDLLIIDEAHGVADWLTKAVSIFITGNRLRRVLGLTQVPRLPHFAKIEEWGPWATEMSKTALVRDRYVTDKAERRKLDRLIWDLDELGKATMPRRAGEEPWIVRFMENTDGVQFSPRWGKDFAEQYLFRGIPHVILTSATVAEDHANYLGIPKAERRYTEVPSPFDARLRPVIWVPTVRVDYRTSDAGKYKLYRRVDEIAQTAIEQGAGNGVIHTGSYLRNGELMRASKFAAAIITHRQDSADYEAALGRFKKAGRDGKFAMMASPRMQEGVNLPDELCRWQIILHLPFPNSHDPLTKARLTADQRYRLMMIAEGMNQMCGRPVRGDGDFATTFVLDDHWAYMRWDCPFAGWFRAGFGVLDLDNGACIEFLTKDRVARLPPLQLLQAQPVRYVELLHN